MSRPSILSSRSASTLSRFARSNVLVGFDFDGTLAPIAPTPSRAQIRATTRRLLYTVAERYPCVVVSGRRLIELEKRLSGIPLRMVFGNFGHEPGAGVPATVVARWVDTLRARLGRESGVRIEEKTYSVALHYRHAPSPERAHRAIAAAVVDLPHARVLEGTLATTIVPWPGTDKGQTLQRARRRFGCETALFVGDDDTDEDAFLSAPDDTLLSIRVGKADRTHARFRLARQDNINDLLERLIQLRPMSTRESAPRARPAVLRA